MKKFLAALVGAGIAFTTMLGNPVSATNIDTDVGGTVIETRYQEISYIVADISIKNGVVFSTGSYHFWLENPEVKLKVIVQESANGKDWEDVKSERYTISLQRDDATILYKAIDRHFYRTKVVLDVYDSSGNYIESGDGCSNSKPYFE